MTLRRALRLFAPWLVLLALGMACGTSGQRSHEGDEDSGVAPDTGERGDASRSREAGGDGSSRPDGARATIDAKADAFGGKCIPEQVASCSCKTGTGTRRCFADGTAWGSCTCASYGTQFFVSPTGSDTNPGTKAAPFLTLERAQTAVRALKTKGGLPAGGVVVWLRGGVYSRQSTFALTNSDSGTTRSPVVYRGYPGETARVMGGVELPASGFQKVTSSSSVWSRLDSTAQGVVVAADLGKVGVTDFGKLQPRGWDTQGVKAALELFIDGVRQPLGRWPDLDSSDPLVTYGFMSAGKVISSKAFTLAENRTTRWTQAPDAWVLGFFAYTWAENSLPVASVDASAGTLTLGSAPGTGITDPIQGAGAPQVMAFNLLEEITEPGEWYLDRTSGLLYLWPPASLAQHELVVSILSEPVVTVTGASDISIQEITLEATRADLIEISGGSSNIQVVGCVLRDAGDNAGGIADGTNNVFNGVLVHDIGETGLSLAGGDRPSLTEGKNVVENSDIHDFSQSVWTYTPAVRVDGNGMIVNNNVLHDAPHSAILYGGSQHTFSENEIYGVCGFSSDAGAIYAGRDWSMRGNVIEWNFIHDIASNMKGGYGVHAVYLDDCLSGIAVNGNVIYNVTGYGIEHGGGRDNLMTNNVFVNTETAVLSADSRCASDPTPISNVPGDSWNFLEMLEGVKYQQNPWASTYPSCAAIPDDYATATAAGSHWLEPEGCTFVNNLGFKYGAWTSSDASTLAEYTSIAGNLQNTDPLFVGEAKLNVRASVSKTPLALQSGSPVVALQGSSPTPFASIGIQP